MANFKIGLEYYSADTDRFQDIRIKRREAHGKAQ